MLLAGLNQNVIAAIVGPLFVAQALSVSVTNCVRQATAEFAIFLQLTSPSLAFWCKESNSLKSNHCFSFRMKLSRK